MTTMMMTMMIISVMIETKKAILISYYQPPAVLWFVLSCNKAVCISNTDVNAKILQHQCERLETILNPFLCRIVNNYYLLYLITNVSTKTILNQSWQRKHGWWSWRGWVIQKSKYHVGCYLTKVQYTFCLCPDMRINHICSYCSYTSQFFLPKLYSICSLLVRGLVTFIKLNKLLNNWWYTIENSKMLTPFRWKRFF